MLMFIGIFAEPNLELRLPPSAGFAVESDEIGTLTRVVDTPVLCVTSPQAVICLVTDSGKAVGVCTSHHPYHFNPVRA